MRKLHLLMAMVAAAGLLFSTGCATTGSEESNTTVMTEYAPLIYAVAYTGAVIHLRDNEQDRPVFRQVKESLNQLLASDTLDAFAVSRALASLPVKELQSDNAQLILSTAASLLVIYDDKALPPNTMSFLRLTAAEARVVCVKLRDALADALAATATTSGS